jgi:serine/threonine-protein kinase
MATSNESSPPTRALFNDDVIELEPTMQFELLGPTEERAGARVGIVEGSVASLASEIHTLRRRRLGSAALFLAVVFAVLLCWSFFGHQVDHWLVVLLMCLRVLIAAGCAALILSRIELTPGNVRAIEYVLFGSFTVILALSQYMVSSELMRQNNISGVVLHMKNGVLGMFALMVIYGMFVPNDPRGTAKVVLTMVLVLLGSFVLLLEHSEGHELVDQLRTTEQAGANALALLIGASLAIYGTYVLNGLRSQLHEARKFGQYQLRQQLGAGGMGEVYLAEHQMLKRPCALKLIKPEAGADPQALARFEREVQSAARLSHPNTIEIYDYGHTDDGTFYYVMEYLPGRSLQDLVNVYGPLPAGRVIHLFRQVCAGLAEAHALGLVHRDLKPGNVFVATRGGEADIAKVLDFGLVKLTRDYGSPELTSENTVSGTPLYMAPEQAAGDRLLDARADIYALGAMMYFALTGRPPFMAPSAFEVLMAHSRDPVVPPSQLRPDVPADLEAVVLRCLEKKPTDRFPAVKSLGKALAACAASADWDAEKAEDWWSDILREPQPQAAS